MFMEFCVDEGAVVFTRFTHGTTIVMSMKFCVDHNSVLLSVPKWPLEAGLCLGSQMTRLIKESQTWVFEN